VLKQFPHTSRVSVVGSVRGEHGLLLCVSEATRLDWLLAYYDGGCVCILFVWNKLFIRLSYILTKIMLVRDVFCLETNILLGTVGSFVPV
jgi:hypothetical protein